MRFIIKKINTFPRRIAVILIGAFILAGGFLIGIVPLFAQDALRPSISITSPTADTTYYTVGNSVIIGGVAADNTTIDRVVWRHLERAQNGNASGTLTWVTPAIVLDEGQNTIKVTAYDTSGNSRDDYLSVIYEVGGGIVAITDPTALDTYITASSSVILKGRAAAGVGNMRWENASGGFNTMTASTSWQTQSITLQEGDNYITVLAW